ncbi:amino acid adenylation domain-containing protein [Nonomuraea sp. NPDC050786]|uniref:non-ribosomal peptide synthetase n=1 Tax=Nonomuraea sp. NPDC050786 TaxID=3154840 RepID=UPI0033D5992A
MINATQHAIWILEQSGRAGSAYHLPMRIALRGPLDVHRFLAACRSVVARHRLLGCAIVEHRDGLALVPAMVPPPVTHLDLSNRPNQADRAVRHEILRGFDLRTGPLIRFTLITLGPSDHLLLVVAHHIVFDGHSKDVLVCDLAAAYNGDELSALSEPDLANSPVTAAAAEFWQARVRESYDMALPALTWPDVVGLGEELALELGGDLAAAADAAGTTRFELLLGLLHVLAFRYGNAEVAVAVDLSTRTSESENHIGLYVNEVPVVSQPAPELTFQEFAQHLRAELREIYRFRDIPPARAVGGLKPQLALCPISLSYRKRGASPRFAGLEAEVDWATFNHAARNPLHVQVVDGPDRLEAVLRFNPGVIGSDDAKRLVGHLRSLLRACRANPQTRLNALPLLSDEERDLLLARWNPPTEPYPELTVPSLIEEQVRRTPDAVAVVAGDVRLTYAELNARAEHLAGGLRRGTVIGLRLPRTADVVVAMLGALKAGAAYLPLEPGLPRERAEFILADSGAAAVLTSSLALDSQPPNLADRRAQGLRPGDPAYLLYTSGSTGRPKGVVVGHRQLAGFLMAMRDRLGCSSSDVWLGLTSLSFDISMVELLLPLICGARVVIVPDEVRTNGPALAKLVQDNGVTHIQATPSGWRVLLDGGFSDPSVVAICGGEALAPALADELLQCTGTLFNAYGPTETTIWSTVAEMRPGRVTIGRPLPGTRVYVLDEGGGLVPVGVPGELCIAGIGVADRYHERPALTAERFTPDPNGPPGSRLYRTGDRVRWTPDGELEFLGRTDCQVKIRGHRVELGEIESRLLDHAAVRHAAVDLRSDVLVAYCVTAQPVDDTDLRMHLSALLPEPMVPGVYVLLDELPLTPNGKIDRRGLPDPPTTRDLGPVEYTGVAAVVFAIWCDLLGLDDIRPDESLFTLGGHSLTIMQIASRLRDALGVDIPIDVFFDDPTINGMVQAVSHTQAAG